jgi:hypothetical protein
MTGTVFLCENCVSLVAIIERKVVNHKWRIKDVTYRELHVWDVTDNSDQQMRFKKERFRVVRTSQEEKFTWVLSYSITDYTSFWILRIMRAGILSRRIRNACSVVIQRVIRSIENSSSDQLPSYFQEYRKRWFVDPAILKSIKIE